MEEFEEPFERVEARSDSLVESHRKMLGDLVGMRKVHALSQETVADRMGVTQAAVSQFERYDSNPKLSTVRRYALAVGARIEHKVIDDYEVPSVATTIGPPVSFGPPVERAEIKTPTIQWGSPRFGVPTNSRTLKVV